MSTVKRKAQFVKCNVCSWEDQVRVFKAAIANSPHKSCDIVIANAGVSGPDPVWQFDGAPALPFHSKYTYFIRFRRAGKAELADHGYQSQWRCLFGEVGYALFPKTASGPGA